LVGGALYGNVLGNDLVWDDRLTPADAGGLGSVVAGRTGSYHRPAVMLDLALEHRLWAGSAVGFHATSVAYHLAVAWLVGALAQALGLGAGAALAAALVFAAHPVQTEAVSYVSGRTDVLAALFALLGLLAWRRARHAADRWALAATAAFAMALLCKEAAVALPLVLLVPGCHPAARPPRPWLPLLVSALWLAVLGPGLGMAGLWHRLPAVAGAVVGYAGLLVWPAPLHLERFTPVAGWSLPLALAAWAGVALVAATLLALAHRVPGGPVFLAFAVLAYAPVSNVVPVHPAIADRALFTPEHFLYLPLLGLAPLVVGELAAAVPARAGTAALAAVLVVWGAVVVDRNRDWRDEETLFRHTIAHDPPAGRVWFNLGNLALAAGRLDEAGALYEAALARDPHDGAAHLNLGITLQRRGRLAAAEERYRQAIADDPRLSEAYRALAALLARRGETAEARRLWERAQGGDG
jgi:hypothetical protein